MDSLAQASEQGNPGNPKGWMGRVTKKSGVPTAVWWVGGSVRYITNRGVGQLPKVKTDDDLFIFGVFED